MKYQKQYEWKVLGKHLINLINLSKFLAILHHKQTYKGGPFLVKLPAFATLLKRTIFLICIFPKEQIFNRAGLWHYFLNRECLLWHHIKNLFQLKNKSLWHKGNWKTRLKVESNFTIYPTVQRNKCAKRSKLIVSQFLSTLEIRKMVVGCALLPGS